MSLLRCPVSQSWGGKEWCEWNVAWQAEFKLKLDEDDHENYMKWLDQIRAAEKWTMPQEISVRVEASGETRVIPLSCRASVGEAIYAFCETEGLRSEAIQWHIAYQDCSLEANLY
jgi:hypothetical protein